LGCYPRGSGDVAPASRMRASDHDMEVFVKLQEVFEELSRTLQARSDMGLIAAYSRLRALNLQGVWVSWHTALGLFPVSYCLCG
jgi:hypothetical protein